MESEIINKNIKHILKIGLTGGIGAGKSYIANLFKELGAPIIMTDLIPPLFLDREDIIKDIKSIIGENAYTNEGFINKKLIADVMFNNPDKLALMNQLFVPIVKAEVDKQCLELHYPYVIIESAIIFETGIDRDMDEVISVYASPELRIDRAMKRSSMTREEVEARMKNQMDDNEKMMRSSILISNDNNPNINKQVRDIHEFLLKPR